MYWEFNWLNIEIPIDSNILQLLSSIGALREKFGHFDLKSWVEF